MTCHQDGTTCVLDATAGAVVGRVKCGHAPVASCGPGGELVTSVPFGGILACHDMRMLGSGPPADSAATVYMDGGSLSLSSPGRRGACAVRKVPGLVWARQEDALRGDGGSVAVPARGSVVAFQQRLHGLHLFDLATGARLRWQLAPPHELRRDVGQEYLLARDMAQESSDDDECSFANGLEPGEARLRRPSRSAGGPSRSRGYGRGAAALGAQGGTLGVGRSGTLRLPGCGRAVGGARAAANAELGAGARASAAESEGCIRTSYLTYRLRRRSCSAGWERLWDEGCSACPGVSYLNDPTCLTTGSGVAMLISGYSDGHLGVWQFGLGGRWGDRLSL